jgi:hypothetical protein
MSLPRSQSLDEQGLETENQVIDAIRHSNERWEQRLTLGNLRLAERYLKGELHLLVEWACPDNGFEGIAFFERAEMPVTSKHKALSVDFGIGNCSPLLGVEVSDESVSHIIGHGRTDERRPDSDKKAMFVDEIESMKTPEYVAISSLVWFDRTDRVFGRLRHALYFSRRFGFVFRGVIGNGEISKLAGSAAIGQNEMIGKVIQGTTKIEEDISSDDREGGRCLTDAGEVKDSPVFKIRVGLGSDFIWVGIQKTSDFNLKITDVLFGPFNFYANKPESFFSGHLASIREQV